MGGSVAVQIAANKTLPSLAGLVVVDVVEVCFLIEKSHLVCTLVKWTDQSTFITGYCYCLVDSHAENPFKQNATFSQHRKSSKQLLNSWLYIQTRYLPFLCVYLFFCWIEFFLILVFSRWYLFFVESLLMKCSSLLQLSEVTPHFLDFCITIFLSKLKLVPPTSKIGF